MKKHTYAFHRELVQRRISLYRFLPFFWKGPVRGLLLVLVSFSAHAQYTLLPIAGNDSAGYYGEGVPARHASLYYPGSICRDSVGNLYFGDGTWGGGPKYKRVRRIDANTGVMTTVAGNGSTALSADSVDNAPATTAALKTSKGVCIDRQGNLLIADGYNRIRKVTLSTGMISTVAGSIMLPAGYSGDGGPATAAQFKNAVDVAVDRQNNIYFLDYAAPSVRKINAATGIISTVAGTGVTGFSGDGGPATAAQIGSGFAVCLDSADNIFITDITNDRIRRVDALTGIITTIAGTTGATSHGDGGPATAAKLEGPTRIAMDKQGNLFFTERSPSSPRISRIDAATGIITTVGGTGGSWLTDSTGDYGPATAVGLGGEAICLDTCGNIFLTGWRHRIRALVPVVPTDSWLCGLKLTQPVNGVSSLQGAVLQGISIAPNPGSGLFMLTIGSQANEVAEVAITDITGRIVQVQRMQTNKETPVQLQAPPGMYLVTATTASGRASEKIIVE
ncbi:MAG: T9SS type A sorting domain-containing protein [Taibaiella sp.]|nr:T9SS type A sorting domain-containing protein [Taibaiella sp.]